MESSQENKVHLYPIFHSNSIFLCAILLSGLESKKLNGLVSSSIRHEIRYSHQPRQNGRGKKNQERATFKRVVKGPLNRAILSLNRWREEKCNIYCFFSLLSSTCLRCGFLRMGFYLCAGPYVPYSYKQQSLWYCTKEMLPWRVVIFPGVKNQANILLAYYLIALIERTGIKKLLICYFLPTKALTMYILV